MSGVRLDFEALHQAILARRERLGVSWRRVAEQAGVSNSSLRRLQAGLRVSAEGFASLVDWLRVPAETFFRAEHPDTGDVATDAASDAEASSDDLREYPVAVTAHCTAQAANQKDADSAAVRVVQDALAREPLIAVTYEGHELGVRVLAVTETTRGLRDGVLRIVPFTRPGAWPRHDDAR